jgi:hypothetical protein
VHDHHTYIPRKEAIRGKLWVASGRVFNFQDSRFGAIHGMGRAGKTSPIAVASEVLLLWTKELLGHQE